MPELRVQQHAQKSWFWKDRHVALDISYNMEFNRQPTTRIAVGSFNQEVEHLVSGVSQPAPKGRLLITRYEGWNTFSSKLGHCISRNEQASREEKARGLYEPVWGVTASEEEHPGTLCSWPMSLAAQLSVLGPEPCYVSPDSNLSCLLSSQPPGSCFSSPLLGVSCGRGSRRMRSKKKKVFKPPVPVIASAISPP